MSKRGKPFSTEGIKPKQVVTGSSDGIITEIKSNEMKRKEKNWPRHSCITKISQGSVIISDST